MAFVSVPLPRAVVAPGVRTVSRWAFSGGRDWPQIRRRLHWITAWPGAPRSIILEQTCLDGVPAEVSRPPIGQPRRAVLYLHGGGYTTGSPRTHWALTGRLSAAMNAAVYSVDYRLAPEHPYPAAIEDMMTAYRALLNDDWPGEQIAVAGDSAGAALALVCALRARHAGIPLPAVLGLICPACDVGTEALQELDERTRDPVLTKSLVHRFAAAYCAGSDPNQPDVSPARAALNGLPPLVIDAASNDLIVAGARDLARRAREAGVIVRYREHTGMWHVFHLMAGLLAAADTAVDEFACSLTDFMTAQVIA